MTIDSGGGRLEETNDPGDRTEDRSPAFAKQHARQFIRSHYYECNRTQLESNVNSLQVLWLRTPKPGIGKLTRRGTRRLLKR